VVLIARSGSSSAVTQGVIHAMASALRSGTSLYLVR
jgi:hypothetical protein